MSLLTLLCSLNCMSYFSFVDLPLYSSNFSGVFNLFEGYGRDASDYEVVKERVQDEYDEQSEIDFKDFFASDLSSVFPLKGFIASDMIAPYKQPTDGNHDRGCR